MVHGRYVIAYHVVLASKPLTLLGLHAVAFAIGASLAYDARMAEGLEALRARQQLEAPPHPPASTGTGTGGPQTFCDHRSLITSGGRHIPAYLLGSIVLRVWDGSGMEQNVNPTWVGLAL